LLLLSVHQLEVELVGALDQVGLVGGREEGREEGREGGSEGVRVRDKKQ